MCKWERGVHKIPTIFGTFFLNEYSTCRRATAADSFAVTDDESEDEDEDTDEDARWKSKLKRPRMAMVADEVETKAASAKSRDPIQ